MKELEKKIVSPDLLDRLFRISSANWEKCQLHFIGNGAVCFGNADSVEKPLTVKWQIRHSVSIYRISSFMKIVF